MISLDSLGYEKVRDGFEGREAIYIEKGVLRVRVMNIRRGVDARRIDAEVEEIPTRGLECGLLHLRIPRESGLLRWDIGAGSFTTFSEHTWHMGYGGWSIFFQPEIVGDFISLAAAWTVALDAEARYNQALRFLPDHGAYERSKPTPYAQASSHS